MCSAAALVVGGSRRWTARGPSSTLHTAAHALSAGGIGMRTDRTGVGALGTSRGEAITAAAPADMAAKKGDLRGVEGGECFAEKSGELTNLEPIGASMLRSVMSTDHPPRSPGLRAHDTRGAGRAPMTKKGAKRVIRRAGKGRLESQNCAWPTEQS